ncbi:MAG: histone deacetylase [Phycisphaerae bacterium]|nr:histone deacetylase [Phycisphaerae bacterium]
MTQPAPPVVLVTEDPGDSVMLAHDASGHRPGHPERPDRLRAVWEALDSLPAGTTRRVVPRPASREVLARVHTAEHIEFILSQRGRGFVIDEDTGGNPSSVDAALVAAGAAVQLVDALCSGSACSGGFALVRPPGHHAEAGRAMGFCLFNNIAAAAAHAVAAHGLDRVLIVDWDVHHGNGTQQVFERRRDVLFFNIHEEGIWPGSGSADERGVGAGEGYTVNVPLPSGSGDAEYVAVLKRVLIPMAERFKPELVLVSAGFDAHARDPLGSMRVTADGFAAMCDEVRGIARAFAGGRLGLVLEGGYDLEGLSASAAACVRVMAGECGPGVSGDPGAEACGVIDHVIALHRESCRGL